MSPLELVIPETPPNPKPYITCLTMPAILPYSGLDINIFPVITRTRRVTIKIKIPAIIKLARKIFWCENSIIKPI